MKKCRVISLFNVVKLCVVWCALLGSCAAADFEMTFEEFLGNDRAEIGTFYPGVRFEAVSTGEDWIVLDATTGYYNLSSWPSGQFWKYGQYWIYDFVSAYTGVVGESGKISFDQYVTYVEIGYSCGSSLYVTAYDAQDNPIDSATGPANRRYLENNASGPGRLRVDAPSDNSIKYVIIHDTGDYWTVDNIIIGTDITLTKEDDTSTCVTPGTDVTYTICYENVSDAAIEDVYILDRLPEGVDYDYIISENPLVVDTNYNIAEHTYRWDLGTVASETGDCVELLVTVNTLSQPLSILHNFAEVWGTTYDANDLPVDTLLAIVREDTPLCCWSNVIYVDEDQDVPGPHTGTSWATAYSNLQDALTNATNGCGNEIRIADGTYNPGDSYLFPPGMYTDTFEIPAGVSVYGGYAGYSDPSAQRNWIKYKTILSGYIGATARNSVVVTMGDGCLLDGCTVEEADWRSIEGISVDFSVYNCTVKDNALTGIYCENGNLDVKWCEIKDNGQEGIYHEGSGKTLSVENCKITGNSYDGIKTFYSYPQIKNSFICQNGLASTPSPYYRYYGINILNPSSSPIIRNNTIAHNKIEGIHFDSNNNAPDIRNCIIWHNKNTGDWHQLLGYGGTYYTCITDPNDIEGDDPNSLEPTARGNIKCNPSFVNGDPEDPDYHITADSPCIDKGHDLYVGIYEKDIDNKDRVYDWLASTANDVDMGADEFSKATDWNDDGIVNLVEFAIFSAAWLSDDQSLNWDDRCDLDHPNPDGVIDLYDLALLADDWLWTDPWHSSEEAWMMMATGGGGSSKVSSSAMATESLATVEAETALTPELTLEERIAQLTEILGWLEDEVSQDEETSETITGEQLQTFIDDIIKILENLRSDYDDN